MNPLLERYLKAKAQAAGKTIGSGVQNAVKIGQQAFQRVSELPQQLQATGQLLNQGYQAPRVQNIVKPVVSNLSPTNYNTPVIGKIRQFNQGLNNTFNNGESATQRMVKSFEMMSTPGKSMDPNYLGDAMPIGVGSISNGAKKLKIKFPKKIEKITQNAVDSITGEVPRIDRTKLSGMQLSKTNKELAEMGFNSPDMGQTMNPGIESPVSAPRTGRTVSPKQDTALFDSNLDEVLPPIKPQDPGYTGRKIPTQTDPTQQGSFIDTITNKPGLDDTDKRVFADWVNSRRAIDVEKHIVKKEFADLDNLGIQGFFDVQAGKKTTPRFAQIRQYLNTKYKQAEASGNIFNYQEEYLPQVWDNTPEEIAQVFGKRMGTRGGFALEKVIDDYQTGIKAGLKPKFEKLSDLLSDYEGRVNKTVADRNFFTHMRKSNSILPAGQAPDDWVTLSPDRFPKLSVDSVQETFKAPKELAEIINNYLYTPGVDGNSMQRGLNAVADYVSKVKNIALSFGVPGTAINSHGINILARHTMFGQGGNMITRFLKGASYMVNQHSSGKNMAQIIPELPAAIKKGLSIGVEDRKNFVEAVGLRSKFGEAWSRTFEVALFDKMIPTLKYDSYKALVKDFSKTMPVDQAQREAAKIANNIYGGINWEQVGRSRDLQNALRIFILAPDWAETTLKLGGNFAKAMKSNSPVARKYQNMMAGFVTAYLGANVANKLSSGKFMWENDSGHTFEIEAGYTEDGQKRYIRPFGTAADMFRIPYDTVLSLAKGDLTSPGRTVRNRLSIPAGVVAGYVSDTDYRGQPIGWKGKDKFGNEIPLSTRVTGVGGEIASLFGMPGFTKQLLKTATGQQGIEQGLAQGFELPVRYDGGAFSKSQKTVEGVAKAGGVKGKDLYDINEKTKGISLYPNQSELLRQGGINMLDPILQGKEARSQKKQIENIIDDIGNGIMTEQEGQAKIDEIINNSGSKPEAKPISGIKEAGAAGYSQKMIDDSRLSLIKSKLEYGQSLTPQEVSLYVREPERPKLTSKDEIDGVLLSKYEGQLTTNKNNIVDLVVKGQLGQEEAISLIQSIDASKALVNQIQKEIKDRTKIKSGGGKKKLKITTPKMFKPRYTPLKAPKLKKVKLVKLKFGKPKKET